MLPALIMIMKRNPDTSKEIWPCVRRASLLRKALQACPDAPNPTSKSNLNLNQLVRLKQNEPADSLQPKQPNRVP
jgi:hypothetical protein